MPGGETPITEERPGASPSGASDIARMALRSTLWVTLGNYFNLLIGFGATLVLTRLLSQEVFGSFSLANFWASLLNVRGYAGLNYAAIQQTKTDGELLGTYFAMSALATAVSFALSAATAVVFLLTGYYSQGVIVALVVLTSVEMLTALSAPVSIALEKELQLSRPMLATLLASIAAYIVSITLALYGAGLWSLLAINPIIGVIGLGSGYWICWRRLPFVFKLRWRFDGDLAGRLLRRGLATGLSLAALGTIVSQFDNFLIGTFVSVATLGFYDRAFRIASWPNVLLATVIARIGLLTMAKVKDDLPRLTHTVRLSLWALSTLGVPMALVLFFGAHDLVIVLYGPRWAESAFFLRFVTCSSLAGTFMSVAFWLSVALGHSRFTALLTIVQAVALVAFATPLTLQFGAIGTVTGVLIAMGLGLAIGCLYIFRQVPLRPGETFGPPLIATAIAALVLIALTGLAAWGNLAPLVRLLMVGAVGPGLFLGSLFLLRRAEMMERLRYFRRTWRNP
jgi:lipopolysaccharide exporter